MNATKTYTNEEILNKGCQVRIAGVLYYCYNVTSVLHFVKCSKDGVIQKPGKTNLLNLSKDSVLRFVELNAAVIEVGSINE